MSSLYNIDYLKFLCSKYGLVPSRKYGQNFLINPEPIAKMLAAAEIKKDDVVVEVGPGFGILTLALSEKVKKVFAFEIEKKLTPYWSEIIEIRKLRNLEIVWGNVLTSLSLRGAVSDEAIPSPGDRHALLAMTEKYKVIANLPYQITSNVIRKFLEAENKPSVMVLMVQKEVAERICAKPGEMSVLSVSVQYYAEPEMVMQVPRSYFWPVPTIDSAMIKLSLRGAVSDEAIPKFGSASQGIATLPSVARNDKQFFKIVKAGFANRRKMLIKNLSAVADKKKLPVIFHELGINEKARAQELSVEQWQKLVKKLEIKN